MIRLIYILFVLFYLFSCSNSHNSSFNSFSESFSKWNIKFSQTPSFSNSYENILSEDKKFSNDMYLNDIKRFSIELNQINSLRLEKSKRLEYSSIKSFLDRQIYEFDKLDFTKWNLVNLLDGVLNHLSYINYLTNSNTDSKYISKEIEYLNDNIIYIVSRVEQQYSSEEHKEVIQGLIKKINNVFDEINSPSNISYYKYNLSKLDKTLLDLNDWYTNEYVKFESIDRSLSDKYNRDYISFITNFKGGLDSILYDAKKSLSMYEKELFDVSLSIYMKNNDEPIWVDIEDTTNVINWTLDSLRSISYNCLDKISVINLAEKTISNIDSYNEKLSFKSILYNNSLVGEYQFHSIFNDSLTIYSSQNSSNLVDNYYESLSRIFPGDIYIQKTLYDYKKGFNSIYINRNYLEGFKSILIDYYLNYANHDMEEDQICNLNINEYIPAVKIYFLLDKIEDCIGTIATIKYLSENKDIDSVVTENDILNLVTDEKREFYKKEIFSYDMSSLIKFVSSNRLMKLYKNKKFDKNRFKKIINLMYENPNSNLQNIERLLR